MSEGTILKLQKKQMKVCVLTVIHVIKKNQNLIL